VYYESAAPTSTSVIQCTLVTLACSGDTPFQIADPTCVADRQCQEENPRCDDSAYYVSQFATPTTNKVCTLITASCSPSFMTAEPTWWSDRQCSVNLPNCDDAALPYKIAEATGTSLVQCDSNSPCADAGSFLTAAATSSTLLQSTGSEPRCDATHYASTRATDCNVVGCTLITTDCTPQYTTAEPTWDSDRQCSANLPNCDDAALPYKIAEATGTSLVQCTNVEPTCALPTLLNLPATYSSVIVCDDPWARFEFENNVVDLQGHVTSATINTGSSVFQPGFVDNYCLSFTGSTWYNLIGTDNTLFQSSFTLAFWIFNYGAEYNSAILSQGSGLAATPDTSNTDQAFLLSTSTTSVLFSFYRDEVASTSEAVGDGDTWSHIVTVYNKAATKLSVYVDGQISQIQTGNTGNFGGTSVPVVLGAKLWTSNNANYKSYKPLKACLDSFLIYKKALSASQILALYNYYNPTVAAVHSNALPECDPVTSSISCPQ